MQREGGNLFQVVSRYQPSGDQPRAIDQLETRIRGEERDVVLMGATGTGKSATTAWLIERLQRPTLVLSHNKTLAAQLHSELASFFPKNAVEYFVSYFDYYQPEAYIPSTDTYIDKESAINEVISELRHSTTASLCSREDVIVVSTVSCIYGLGNPEYYASNRIEFKVGQKLGILDLLTQLANLRYLRNNDEGAILTSGTFRVRGDTVDIIPAKFSAERALRIEIWDSEIEAISLIRIREGELLEELQQVILFPNTHFVAEDESTKRAIGLIEEELKQRLAYFEAQGKFLEMERLKSRTEGDLEMIMATGSCRGIENYSRHFDGRLPGQRSFCLLDYFPKNFLTVIDESHVAVPQIGGMCAGDHKRKMNLVNHGFRLPSAYDHRPLTFDEFREITGTTLYLSATPGDFELEQASGQVEQIIRPTGLVDPEIIVCPETGQIDDMLEQIRLRQEKNERSLVMTTTKRMAEKLQKFLQENQVPSGYIHADIPTLKRVDILDDLREGQIDVLVGINLLREGLDLPDVSLVMIFDAGVQGLFRSRTSLIQMIGRAARHVSGQVRMYADRVSDSMREAIEETNRRRNLQIAYNREHNIDPQSIREKIRQLEQDSRKALQLSGGQELAAQTDAEKECSLRTALRIRQRGTRIDSEKRESKQVIRGAEDIRLEVEELRQRMKEATDNLDFEIAAILRDQLRELSKLLEEAAS